MLCPSCEAECAPFASMGGADLVRCPVCLHLEVRPAQDGRGAVWRDGTQVKSRLVQTSGEIG